MEWKVSTILLGASLVAVLCLLTFGACDRPFDKSEENPGESASGAERSGDQSCRRVRKKLPGSPPTITTYEYDDDGRLVRAETYEGSPSDSEPSSITTYRYQNGRRAAELVDEDADGQPDEKTTYSYDDGKRVRATYYSDIDGKPVSAMAYRYDDEGNRIRKEHYDEPNTDGDPVTVTTHTYENGRRTLSERYLGSSADSLPGNAITYHYDDRGNLIRKESHRGGEPDGEVMLVKQFSYECP